MNTYHIETGPHDGKKIFRELGTCSRTFFYLLNREFGHPRTLEESAASALAGGIMQKGHQCGMLWGASLAIGAAAFRSTSNMNKAIRIAILATQNVMTSFLEREGTIKCRDITRCDFSSKWSYYKYLITGRFLHCFDLAQKWAPEAVQVAAESLSGQQHIPDDPCYSCATEVAKKMGATDEQMVMVAGFSGGLGLSQQACGALSAAIWMRSLEWAMASNKTTLVKNPNAEAVLERFYKASPLKILCSEITGCDFRSVDDHSRYIAQGGCSELINTLAEI